jgi:predicted DNA binding CopG/RHH family protein
LLYGDGNGPPHKNQDYFRAKSDEKRIVALHKEEAMKKEYDLSKMKGHPNPYAKRLKKQMTIRMGSDIIVYFKSMAENTGIPYQNLINLYLQDCVQSKRKLTLNWAS